MKDFLDELFNAPVSKDTATGTPRTVSDEVLDYEYHTSKSDEVQQNLENIILKDKVTNLETRIIVLESIIDSMISELGLAKEKLF